MPQIMPKTAIIVHRWGGNPKDDWYPALRMKLIEQGYQVLIPSMPDTDEPEIHAWVSKLREIASEVDSETILIGHSIGCQTILRWLAMLPKEKKVGKVFFVAPWTKLIGVEDDADSQRIAKPWIETPIDWNAARQHAHSFTCVFSDDDPYVALSETSIFKEKLHATIIIEKNRGHMTEKDEPVVIETITRSKYYYNR